MNAKKERAKKTRPATATERSGRTTEVSEASPAEAPQNAAEPIVKTFSSEPIDTRTGAGSGLVLVIRNGEQVDPSQWRENHWELVMQRASRCQQANKEPWLSEPLRMTRRTRADDVQFPKFVLWNKDLHRFLTNEFLLRVGSLSPTESAKLRDACVAWHQEIAMQLDRIAPEEWLGVRAALFPKNLRDRIRQASSRGRIRSRADTRRPRNPAAYCLADCLRVYPEQAAIRELRRMALEDWESGQREHVMGLDHPVALPVRLGELVVALDLLRASQRLALDASPQAAESTAKKRVRRKSDK